MQRRTVFFISDGTGITAESLGRLLVHFPEVQFRQERLPFTHSPERIDLALSRIAAAYAEDGVRPVVIMTLVKPEWRARFKASHALCLDLFGTFIDPLAEEFQQEPDPTFGIAHSVLGNSYYERIDAINYSMGHDDGTTEAGLEEASIILIGVSRCGKTPTSLYLAMQYGIKVANYPLIPEDFERGRVPDVLKQHADKLFGLTIRPERLHIIRTERRPDSVYASLKNCRNEIRLAEALMQRENVAWIDTTSRSIEELASTIVHQMRHDQENLEARAGIEPA